MLIPTHNGLQASAAAHHRPVYTSDNLLFASYGPNQVGRDFVVGDIHGEFTLLRRLMSLVGFDEKTDRLFSVGDLVDRGPESPMVVRWLQRPWFIPVRGNHDHWCIEAGLIEEPAGHRRHGGAWFYDLPAEVQPLVATLLNQMPVAIEVEARDGRRFGIVHAECTHHSWQRFREALEGELGDSYRNHHIIEAIWRRSRIEDKDTTPVAGIDKVLVGHTVVKEVTELGNVVYLDTGGCFEDGHLTLFEIGGAGEIISAQNTSKHMASGPK